MYDLVAQHATGFSYRQCPTFSLYGRMEPVTDMLKRLRESAEPKLSVRKMAELLKMHPSTYATYETAAKFKKPVLPMPLTKALAEILSERGVPHGDVMRLAGVTGELKVELAQQQTDDEWVEVLGSVQAGVFRVESEWAAAERYDVRFGKPPYVGAERFGVRMEGLSMNRTIPHGADLECLWIKFARMEPQPGDLVIVERTRHDLTEMTCKRLGKEGDELVLLCESTEPEFQDVIHVGKPDPDAITDDETRIIGIVLSAKVDLAPKGLSGRRYRVR